MNPIAASMSSLRPICMGHDAVHLPDDVPSNLHHLARKLSWDDAAQLLCLLEGWAIKSGDRPDIRAGLYQQAGSMRVLVNTLPFDWDPPDVGEKSILKWLAGRVRADGVPTA
jgi:hypothetical protein